MGAGRPQAQRPELQIFLFCGFGDFGFFDQSILRGLVAIQNGAAGFADGHIRFDGFAACGALGLRVVVVDPGLVEFQFASGASLEIGDEHEVVGTLPLKIGVLYQPAVKASEFFPGLGDFRFGGFAAGGDENAVKTSLPRVAVENRGWHRSQCYIEDLVVRFVGCGF